MQETEFKNPNTGETETLREFFAERVAERANKTVEQQMDERLRELSGKGHTLVRRVRVGRNDPCPCGSGLKFKRCCIDKIRRYRSRGET